MRTSSFSNSDFYGCMNFFCLIRRCLVSALILFLLFTSFFFGCTKAPELPKEKVRIAVTEETLAALVMVADTDGLFFKNGLDAEVKYYATGRAALNAMLSGEADFATATETHVVFSSFQRQDFSILASIGTSDNESVIIARRSRGIQNVGDLAGRNIATVKGSATQYFMSLFMMKHGLSAKVALMKPEEMPEALDRGGIDAFAMREPYISQAKERLGDDAVIFSEPGMYIKIYNLIGMDQFIKSKPEAVKKVLKSLNMAETVVRKDRARVMNIISAKLEIKKDTAAAMLPELIIGLSLGHQLLVALEYEARWGIGAGFISAKKIPDYLKFIDSDALMAVKPEAVTLIR